jgi:hypothetical protein
MNVLERRQRLCAAGYVPIPLFGKEPPIYGKNNKRKGFDGWQQTSDVTLAMLRMWEKTWPDAINTGILTRLIPTLDLDILNEDAARALEDAARPAATATRAGAETRLAHHRRRDRPPLHRSQDRPLHAAKERAQACRRRARLAHSKGRKVPVGQ